MGIVALGTAAEVVRHTPTIWGGIRSGYTAVRTRLGTIRSALSGAAVADVNEQLLHLTEEVASIVDSLEETTDRLEELEGELDKDRANAVYNREVFRAVWEWSQQGWWKRAFTRPKIPTEQLWRNP